MMSLPVSLFFLLFTLFSCPSYTQHNYDFQLVGQIEQNAHWMEVDKMQQLYILVDEYTLQKYDATGHLQAEFNENNLGSISYIDVSNPFRILVYYDNYATVIFLDRTLSEIQRHDLSSLDLPQVEALGTASDNTLWLFDQNTYTLKKVDAQNNVLVESVDLTLLFPDVVRPIRLLEANNRIYINSPNLGLLVFDNWGNYLQTIPLLHLEYFQWYEGQIFYTRDKKLQSYHLSSFQQQTVEVPLLKENLEQLSIAQDYLYAKYPQKIAIIRARKK